MRYNYDFNDPVDRFKFMEDAHNEIVNRFLDGLLVHTILIQLKAAGSAGPQTSRSTIRMELGKCSIR